MPLIPVLALLAALSTVAAVPDAVPGLDEPGVLSGVWEGEMLGPRVGLELRVPGGSAVDRWTLAAATDSVPGLEAASGGDGNAFEMSLDAGRFLFVGVFSGELGHGGFTFVPDVDYATALVDLGLRILDPTDYLTLAARNISRAALRNLRELGYRVRTVDELVGMTGGMTSPPSLRLFDPAG